MLQIASGMYFRAGIPLNETVHRAAFHTNAARLVRDPIDLPIGSFTFSTSFDPINAVLIEATDRLEALNLDGEPEFMIATHGRELLDDAADVFSFTLNITCVRNRPLLESLVPTRLDQRPTMLPTGILRRTFDPCILITEDDVTRAKEFATALLALRRDHFEAAMRAIRIVVDASMLVSDDPGLAYTLYVAALESLAQVATRAADYRSWDTYPGDRRKIIDKAITAASLTDIQADQMRDAVLEVDDLSLRRRFVDFTLDHVTTSYYRYEAAGADRPISATDLHNALTVAYQQRSRTVHELVTLPAELWALTLRADTLRWKNRPVLSLEGLNRLSRHVIANFVERAPTNVDTAFNYREHLPGIVQVELAPQLWIWRGEGYDAEAAPRVLDGFIHLVIETQANPNQPATVVDMAAVLEAIEQAIGATPDQAYRQAMIALYVLWHRIMAVEHHRPGAEGLIDRHVADIEAPCMPGYAVALLTDTPIPWTTDDLLTLLDRRRHELRSGKGQPLPPRLDAALLLTAASRLWDDGRTADAIDVLAKAVETVAGDETLIAIERAALDGTAPDVDPHEFVLAPARATTTDDRAPEASDQLSDGAED